MFVFSPELFAQGVVDQLGFGATANAPLLPDMATEKINRISGSKKIFIITNNAGTFNKGDFITLVLGTKRAARAVVAKNENGIAGIKILKIYSLALWNQLRTGGDVQVLRGDDSMFNVSAATATAADSSGPRIQSEDNLFDETTVLEDESLSFEDDSKRILKNDNIVSLSLGMLDVGGTEGRVSVPTGSWSYQIEDNIWLEVGYGQGVVKSFPASDIDTKVTSFTVKAKYAVRAPLDSFALPYIGYQIQGASSPGAGQQDDLGSRTEEELQQELDDVETIKKNQIIFGATLLKRLVPGWFVRVDVGADIIAGGFSLEF